MVGKFVHTSSLDSVVINGASFRVGNEPLEPTAVNSIMQQLEAGDNEAFGVYPNEKEYLDHLRHNGFMVALVSRPKGEHPEVVAKGGMIIGGMGSLAVAKYEENLPVGIAHHEGYFTIAAYKGLGLQRRVIDLVEQEGCRRGVAEFTVAFESTNTTSQANFVKAGYLPGIAFDSNYLTPPNGEQERIACLVGLKVSEKKLPVGELEGSANVIFDPRDDDKNVFHDQIAELIDKGFVCIRARRKENENIRDIPESAQLKFVPITSLPTETATKVRTMQAQIRERL